MPVALAVHVVNAEAVAVVLVAEVVVQADDGGATSTRLGVMVRTFLVHAPPSFHAYHCAISDGGGNYGVWRFNGAQWVGVEGGGVAISVDPTGNPWIVNAAGNIWKWF